MRQRLYSLFLSLAFVLITLGASVFVWIAASDAAPTCRMVGDRTICIMNIKRSAKNYWEYRASVKIDDQVFPVARYNCRDRTKTSQSGQTTPFQPNGAGTFICQLLYR